MRIKYSKMMPPMKNNSRNKALLVTLSICVLLTGIYTHSLLKLTPAPDVSFKTITNKTIRLKDLQTKVVLITFWASNCASCIKEIAYFKSLYQDYHQQGLEIIAIAMYYDRPNYVVDTSKAYNIPYDIVLDLDMSLTKAFGDISLTPTTLLLNPQGEIFYQATGLFDLTAMQKRIAEQLQQLSILEETRL